MGLNFRGSNAQWSYSGFNSFRERLANEIKINLREMAGFTRDASNPGNDWNEINDPIALFLNHSDCEGELAPDACLAIAPRLRELVSNWDECYDRVNALTLADDMEYMATCGESLKFC
jgi:hypothetical protein